MAKNELVFRQRHSDRTRTMDDLFLELEEWLQATTDATLGYGLTFKWTDPASGIERNYHLHDDSTRAAIESFVRRYRQPGPVFVSARANSGARKPCVRFVGSSRAEGFYNHSEDNERDPTRLPPPRRTSEETAPAIAPRDDVAIAVRRSAAFENATPATVAPRSIVAVGPTATGALDFLTAGAERSICLSSWEDWLAFRAESVHKSWVYYARFGPEVFAWGTASKRGHRLRKTSLFDDKLTGKYDRRVDYLMLKIIHGEPIVWVFEAKNAVTLESTLKALVRNRYCFGGITAQDRKEISRTILAQFVETPHWRQQSDEVQTLFREYLDEVYFAGRSHPKNGRRTFHFGDSLEPGFIDRALGRPELIPAIEATLRVRF